MRSANSRPCRAWSPICAAPRPISSTSTPRIIATSDDIVAIVLDDQADVPALKGWRRSIFGDKALAIKHGRMGLAATRKGVVEFPIPES